MSDAATTSPSAPDNSGPKELREALERAQSQLAEANSTIENLTNAARADKFDRAGVPEQGWGSAFRSTYDGELTEAAIKSKVEDWGIPTGTPQQPQAEPQGLVQPDTSNPELEALAQAQALRGEPPAQIATDPALAALQALDPNDIDGKQDIYGDITEALAANNMLRSND